MHLLIITCIQLACKQTEVPRKIRDVINVGYWLLRQDDTAFLEIDDTYFKLRDSVTNTELVVLRILNYDLSVDLAHSWVCAMVHDVSITSRKVLSAREEWKMFAIAALSWAIANDAYLDADLALNTSSKEIGLAAVYLAVKEICHDLIPSFEKWVSGWSNKDTIPSARSNMEKLLQHIDSLASSRKK